MMNDKHRITEKGKISLSTSEIIGHELIKFWIDHSEWSQKTFGEDHKKDGMGALKHLLSEVQEVIDEPMDKLEYADCLILLFDAWRRHGGTLEGLLNAAKEKLQINKTRKWGKPDEQGIIFHIES